MKYAIATIFKVFGLFFVVSTVNTELFINDLIFLLLAFLFFILEYLVKRSDQNGNIIMPDEKELKS